MARVEIEIIGRDNASRAFDTAGRSAHGMSTHVVALGTMLGGMAASGVTALGSLAVSAVKTGIETASSMEGAEIAFETLLHSADKAKTFVSNLSKFAENTPFRMDGLVDSSRLLLGVGQAANSVIPTLTDFGDAAAANNVQQDGFQRIMQATTQAISAGKFQQGDLNQIMGNGIPVWKLLSESMHKPVPELQKLASQGKLLASDVMPALQAQMHKDYGGSMEKQSRSLAGLWGTMQDTFSLGMAEVLKPLVPLLKAVIPGAMTFLAQAFTKGANAMTALTSSGHSVGPVLQQIGQWIGNNILPVVRSLVQWFTGSLIPAWQRVAGQVGPALMGMFRSFSQTLQQHKGFVDGVRQVFAVLGVVITGVLIPVLGKVVQIFINQLGPAFRYMVAIMQNVVFPAIRFLGSLFMATVGIMVHAAAQLFGWVPGVGPKLQSAARAFDTFQRQVNASLNRIPRHVDIYVNGHYSFLTSKGIASQIFPGRAAGGPVTAGGVYTVGENGPETFVPTVSGTIVPNLGHGGSGGGGRGGPTIVVQGFVGSPTQLATALVNMLNNESAGGRIPALRVRTA